MSTTDTIITRPPVVAIMGHVDHGKSTLLDTIRHTNIVATESGGITQHVSAYEVAHPLADGTIKKITFIDTPGHAAFKGIRERSANIADIAILIVAADDGVKAQTLEALATIQANNVPFLVAINKIDKPAANVERVKFELAEHGVFLEGFGGTISYVTISAKSGQGLDELLETILLLAEMNDYTADISQPATGFVIESHRDPKRGISAVLLVKDGTLAKGQFVVTGDSMTSVRILEDFTGNSIDSATVSAPIQVVGFSKECPVGMPFVTCETKKQAEEAMNDSLLQGVVDDFMPSSGQEINVIPVIVKCDVVGSIDAVVSEIQKVNTESIYFKVVRTGVGDVTDADLQLALADPKTIIIGFHVHIDQKIKDAPETKDMLMREFTIIYKMSEWLIELAEERKFKKNVEVEIGRLSVLKVFSADKGMYLIGGRVESGVLTTKDKIKLIMNDTKIAQGTIDSIQVGKTPSSKVESGDECGIMVELNNPPQAGAQLLAYENHIQ
jgi:translation initiation factor IF-2